ncbi:MFS general substrate transporter [Dentipellis sp. KUC8613]|nr:MFS general substrate transporter [Dentipellis sp. KUC8613]
MSTPERSERPDEETPLLPSRSSSREAARTRTPLPKLQLSLLIFLQMADPITSQCIFPFVNQLIRDLDITHGDEEKVGYYAGLIEALFYVAQAITVLQWSRLSDYVGRKPIVIVGLSGIMISMVCFGLSRSYAMLMVSRCICGALNGNVGLIKSLVAEITDETNLSRAIPLMTVAWAVGSTIGPLIGGLLARPAQRFPKLFSQPFWTTYPYFLPCAAVAGYVLLLLIAIVLFMKEPVHKDPPVSEADIAQSVPVAELAEGATIEHDEAIFPLQAPKPTNEHPLPLREVLTGRVILAISNYATLGLLDVALFALFPLFMSTPITLGGLGVSPATIGLCLGAFGLSNGLLQMLVYSRIVEAWGPKRLFVVSLGCFIPIWAFFPLINAIARAHGLSNPVWVAVGTQILLWVIMDMAYGAIYVFLISAVPNKRSLGATNGLAQTVISLQRAVGPVLSTSLFAFTLERNILGGQGVYVALIVLSGFAVGVASKLPRKPWKHD